MRGRRRSNRSFRPSALLALLALGCERQPTAFLEDEAARVVVAPQQARVAPGDSVEFSAVAYTRQDERAEVTVTWQSTGGSVQAAGQSEKVHWGKYKSGFPCGYNGITTDTVIAVARPGKAADTAYVAIDCPDAPVAVATVSVTPASATVSVGGTQQFTATLKDSSGNTLTGRSVSWASGNTGAATVNASSGLASGVAAGSTTITATAEGQRGTATLTVQESAPAPVASVTVTPGTATVSVGGAQQFTATLKDAVGNTLSGRSVSWTSSNLTVATVSSGGLATALAVGSATITATSEGRSGSATITGATAAPVAAFPGAEGFGRSARGGRGGKVYVVVNTNDGGAGSLRECVEASGPRTCVFRVSGTIALNSSLVVANPYITIAGQSAPGGGITLRAASTASTAHLQVETHDVIIRYIRSRPGTTVENGRALTVSKSGVAPYNVIIDHVSLSWSGDEIFITWYDTKNITVQWSNLSESLPAADGGYKGPNLGDGGTSGWLSFHHNLLAHHNQRFPLTRTGEGPIDLVNNVMYNLGTYGYANLRQATKANLVGNYVKPGPNSTISVFVRDEELVAGGYYHSGNVVEPGWSVGSFAPDNHRVSTRYSAPPVTTTSAQQAFDDVLAGSGAVHGLRCDGTRFDRPDAVDARIVASVRNGTRGHTIPREQTSQGLGFIADPADVGGWPQLDPGTPCADSDNDGMPDVWEQANGLNPGVNDSAQDLDGDGYTNLEEYLNGSGR